MRLIKDFSQNRKIYKAYIHIYVMTIVTLQLKMDDRLFKRLQNKKELQKLVGKCKNWEDFILKECKIIK